MVSPHSSFRPSRFTQLVTHLHEFGDRQRERIAELYGAPAFGATELAEYWVRNPEEVVEVVRSQLSTSLGWRIVEEAVLEHDVGTYLDWAPAQQRHHVARLGLLDPKLDQDGHWRAVMPAALAAIFASRVRGQRGSLPVLLGRQSVDDVRQLAARWDLSTEGSKIEIILRVCDYFGRAEMVEEILETLPSPDWIGDALMVLELGGICHWNQLYNYDLDQTLGQGPSDDNVVPLMRNAERRKQREIAETLEEFGILVRIEQGTPKRVMAAVPEELWGGLWKLGRRWLMDWCHQGVAVLKKEAAPSEAQETPSRLRGFLKWWVCEAEQGRLRWESDTGELSAESRAHLSDVHSGETSPQWDDIWQLGRDLRILTANQSGAIEIGPEASSLLDRRSEEFVAEVLLEWCLSYSGGGADEPLVSAIGLDDAWRSRAVSLMVQHAEPVPTWMHHSGVEPGATGGGWLRESGTGPDEIVLFEVGLVTAFVLTTKVLWLDLLRVVEANAAFLMDDLARLMQCVAGLAMFDQLGRVLEEQPAPVYLPFQRASFLLDRRVQSLFRDWVDGIVTRLLVPLGVATLDDRGDTVGLRTDLLRVEDPPRWPAEVRRELISEIFEDSVEFDAPGPSRPDIRGVVQAPQTGGESVDIDEPVERLLELVDRRDIATFDGRFISFSSQA